MSGLLPPDWQVLYENPLAASGDVRHFRMEGEGTVTFPLKRMRLESAENAEDGQQRNFVFWCPDDFPPDMAVSWDFWPIREPGLAILFFAPRGRAERTFSMPPYRRERDSMRSTITARWTLTTYRTSAGAGLGR